MVRSQVARRARWGLVAAGLALGAVVLAPAAAQVPPVLGTTTTTAPPATTTTTAAPSGGSFGGTQQAPAGAHDAGGDGAAAPAGGIVVPPEAQRIIDAVRRSGPSSTATLVQELAQLEALGLSRDETLRVGLGRFPIAGVARYSHDWLYPRYGPGFRFHLGTDVFAPHGTPVRAPVDGVARTSTSELGGLSVKVVMPDGTYFYLAHLSGLVDGFVDGMAVRTGDIVGYVGDSGNARGGAPHLHLGIYPYGGPPVDPKPILDGFIEEARARIPELVAVLQARAEPAAAPAALPRVVAFHPLAEGGAGVPVELLYATAANPVDGPRALLQLAVDDLVAGIDWSTR